MVIVSIEKEIITKLLLDLLTISPDYMALNIPLYELLVPNKEIPRNYIDLQLKFGKMETKYDIQQLRMQLNSNVNDNSVSNIAHDKIVTSAWGIFKDTLRKRGECELREDDPKEGQMMIVLPEYNGDNKKPKIVPKRFAVSS
ncbi:hypothetical protein HK100_007005 [Physocladia obscura]|uniref:Uncharacterized protein n=1 Tax=Physocladia obscura TaxID=109957 RepID=A0AAD5T4X6_9FUNG|nr:hypothetical protein HK100_007005 [Physocladia obscura]